MAAVLPNAVQAEHWNGTEGHHWATQHERYEAMLGPFGARVLDAVAIQPGGRVLDVGCGAGDLSLAAGWATGSEGRVVGIDLSEPMLDTARRRASVAGLGNVSFVAGDAQTYGFGEGELDVVVSRFGVMFFADPVAAFTNLARALRPGGRLGFVCWQDAGVNEWMLVPSMAALAHVPPPDPAVFETVSPFEFADTGRVTEILQAAGFTDVGFRGVEQPLLFGGGGTVDDAVEFFRDGSFGATLLTGAGPEETATALAAVAEAFSAHVSPRGVDLGAAAWLVTAATAPTCLLASPASC
jgi:ubiquinone/menaquinone biosynthesis C-methylase UbiE